MPLPDDLPELEKTGFRCPHCNAFAQQMWGSLGQGYQEDFVSVFSALIEPVDGRDLPWSFARCGRCSRSSIWLNEQMVYPRASTMPAAHADMPEAVRPLYNEAREVASVSRRAGAAMARATIELLLRTVLPEVTTVPAKSQLDDLIALAEPMVSLALETPLLVVRHAGNKSLHVEPAPDGVMVLVLDDSETEVMELIFETINELVSELVTRRNRNKKYEALIPQGVRESAERKRLLRADQAEGTR